MKMKSLPIVAAVCVLAALCFPASGQTGADRMELGELGPLPVHSSIGKAVGSLLSSTHYTRRAVDNSLSSEMFDLYLEQLDSSRLYFLQPDIDAFQAYRHTFDDAIQSGDLTGAFLMFNRFERRLQERHARVRALLGGDFDFSIDEYFDMDRTDDPWAATEAELDEIWRKRVKNEVLSLRLAGKDSKDAAETLLSRYDTILKRISQTESEDVFDMFLNAFTATFDPHTSYMSPRTSDDFRIRVSKSLEGIGASLQTEEEFTKVTEIVPGGPADKSGLLHTNDRIVGVGQGDDGKMVDVIGWRIDDVVQLIRGPKGSKVKLQILPADAPVYGEPKTIAIVRDKVKLADRMAKSRVRKIQYRGGTFTIGVIEIPDFYFDYESMQEGDPDYPSTSRDVQRLLADLQAASVDGIIVDLRGNGGGFLSEAINLTGLFIKDGPVVQVRDVRGRVTEQTDRDPRIYYDGPLAVLVDRLSASASEIFAAAIQDYGRGIVVGSTTFGKGTVQSIVTLDRMLPESREELGQVKLTIAKFYRVNGSSTQHVGVTPDFLFPSRYQAMEVGESNLDNALLWDRIEETAFTPFSDKILRLLPGLARRSESRTAGDPEFQYLREDIERLLGQRDVTRVSLQEERRRREREAEAARDAERDKKRDAAGREEEDPFVMETGRILGDYLLMSRSKAVAVSP